MPAPNLETNRLLTLRVCSRDKIPTCLDLCARTHTSLGYKRRVIRLHGKQREVYLLRPETSTEKNKSLSLELFAKQKAPVPRFASQANFQCHLTCGRRSSSLYGLLARRSQQVCEVCLVSKANSACRLARGKKFVFLRARFGKSTVEFFPCDSQHVSCNYYKLVWLLAHKFWHVGIFRYILLGV